MDEVECTPAAEDAFTNLTSTEAYNYFSKAINVKLPISLDPPVQPKAGSLYIYDLWPDLDKRELRKRKLMQETKDKYM